MNTTQLQDYANAWNGHDIDRIMDYMTFDCVFETGGCDRFTFEGDKIKSKRSYVKNRATA